MPMQNKKKIWKQFEDTRSKIYNELAAEKAGQFFNK